MAPITCVIIGEGNIALSCLRRLQEFGFRVEAVLTNTTDLILFCEEYFITAIPRKKNIETFLKDKSFDYLFSVNNPTILSPEVLSFARKLTINYHDSLLPAYAGVHATSWAIIQGERTHGISWHVVEPGIDTGDILQYQVVEIEDNDSALTLNLKCFEACTEVFKRLVEDIVGNQLKPIPQNLKKRSYFGLYKVPPNLGVLCLEQEGRDSYNLARALEFGAHDNQLGSPKICTPSGSFLLVTRLDIYKGFKADGQYSLYDPSARTVLDVSGDTIIVATSSSPLSITVAELDGHPVKSGTLNGYGVRKGADIPSVSGLDMEMAVQLRKKEPFWRRVMRSYEPTMFFVQKLDVLPDLVDIFETKEIRTKKISVAYMESSEDNNAREEFLLSSFIAFVARSCCSTQVHVGLMTTNRNITQAYRPLYSSVCPTIFDIDFTLPVHDAIDKITKTMISSYRNSGTFLLDMNYRYQELRGARRYPHHNMVIVLERDVADVVELAPSTFDSRLLIVIGAHTITISHTNKLRNSYTRIEDVLYHFPAFLKSIASAPNKSISLLDIDLISPSEKQILYGAPAIKEADEQSDILPHIYDVVRKHPNAIAISTTDSKMQYGELLDEVNCLSSNIQLHLPDEYRTELKCIAIHMTNSVAYVTSLLASTSANCPFLPLPQNIPMHRLAFMLQDARATIMLTTREIQVSDKFREIQPSPEVLFEIESEYGHIVMLRLKVEQTYSAQILPASQLPEVYSFTSLTELANEDDADVTSLHTDCCYVMYTSGSTGRPKGVQVLQSGVLNMARAQIDAWALGPRDIIAQFASIGFDASISEIFTALMSGATLAILKDSERLGQEFTNAMAKLEVTTITLPPSVLNIYKPTEFPKLQKVVTAGEACTLLTAVRWSQNTHIRFFNAYGPTESTVCATIHEFDPTKADDTLSKELPIGKAIEGVQMYLLDDLMKPVPPNLVGEIFIGGQSLSAGYIGHARSKNDERFVDNPLFPGCKLYRTGDHAIQAEDGTLTYFGRMDDQVKIRGQRVDLNEIEQVLLQHSKVELAVAVKHQTSPNSDPTISAFIAPTFVFISELREYLSKALPSYMIPVYIKKMNVEEFPVNLNGKIDRRKLEKDMSMIRTSPDVETSHLSLNQLKMAKLWCRILQLDKSYAYNMHRFSSFSELGGNSLHMVLLQRAIENEFGVLLSFTDLGATSNIQDFSDLISRKKHVTFEFTSPNLSNEDLKSIIIRDAAFDPKELAITDKELFSESNEMEPCPKNILLSGTTGFLGAYLLYEILEQTDAHVCCMVRESTEVRGFGRLVSNMRKYDLWKTRFESRIAIVLSDLSKPCLGIAPDIYKAMSIAVDTVFMNAAKMNFNTDYFDHCVANVTGTKEFIKFCFTGRKKYLFTTSSLGVFLFPPQRSITSIETQEPRNAIKSLNGLDTNGNCDNISHQGGKHELNNNIITETANIAFGKKSDDDLFDGNTVNVSCSKRSYLTKSESTYIELISNSDSFKVNGFHGTNSGHATGSQPHEVKTPNEREAQRVLYRESDQIDDPSTLSGGYNQSKWASEQLVVQALRYLPGGAIFRPARVSGHSKTAMGPTNDLFACILRGIESLKCAPDLDFPFDLTPVDYCARGMIEIMTQVSQKHEHQEMPVVYHFFNNATIPFIDLFKGPGIEIVPLEEWRVRVKSAERENDLVPFTPFIQSDFWDRSPEWPVFDCDNTMRYISADCKKLLIASGQLLTLYRGFINETKN